MVYKNVEFFLFLLLIGIFFVGIILSFAFFISRGANPPLLGSELSVGNIVLKVEVARSASERARGLSGRASLAPDDGMYFIFGKADHYGFWMKDMQFPIDMIWVKGGVVAGFSENAAPEPGVPMWNLHVYYPPDVADTVLEVSAGFVASHHIAVGDAVALRS